MGKKIIVFLFIIFSLESCVIHSSPPFICFAKGCIQSKQKNKAVVVKVKKNRVVNPSSRKSKGEVAKVRIKHKKTPEEIPDGVRAFSKQSRQ